MTGSWLDGFFGTSTAGGGLVATGNSLAVSPDGVTIEIVGGKVALDPTLAARVKNTWINAKEPPFNATGDGTTDDTSAIQAALTYVASIQGATLYIPAGVYRCGALTLTGAKSFSIIGERPTFGTTNGTVIKWNGGSSGVQLTMTGVQDFTLQRVMLDGTQTGASTVTNLSIQSNNSPATSRFRVLECQFERANKCVLIGDGAADHQNDSWEFNHCAFINFQTSGIELNSANAGSGSVIDACQFSGADPSNSVGVRTLRAGFIEVRSSVAGGTGGMDFFNITAGTTDTFIIKNCESEGFTNFLRVNNGAGDDAAIILIGNSIATSGGNISLSTICRVVGLGNQMYNTLTLAHAGAKYINMGDRFRFDKGARIDTSGGGVYSGQDVQHSTPLGDVYGQGQMQWTPPGTSPVIYGDVVGELCVRSGLRVQRWSKGLTVSTGDYVQPTIDDGHVYQAANSGTTSGTTEPTWAASVGDNGITWNRQSVASSLHVPFAPLRQYVGTAAPAGNDYYAAGSAIWNKTPALGTPGIWMCSVAGNPYNSGTPGTFLGIYPTASAPVDTTTAQNSIGGAKTWTAAATFSSTAQFNGGVGIGGAVSGAAPLASFVAAGSLAITMARSSGSGKIGYGFDDGRTGFLDCDNNGANGVRLSAADNLRFGTNDTNPYASLTFTERVRIDKQGSVMLAMQGALATNATDGFTYIPTCAGTPTGTPTAHTGMAAMVYDTTNNKLYAYNGAWKSVTLA